MIFGLKKDPRKSADWRNAEKQFQELFRKAGFSFFGSTPVSGALYGELDAFFGQLLNTCPHYYPAWLALGYNRLRQGKSGDGLQYLFKALDSMQETVEDPEELEKILTFEAKKMEQMMCFAESAQFLEKAAAFLPEAAGCYDDWAYCLSNIPGEPLEKALALQRKALELSPENDALMNDMGWIYLMAGHIPEAVEWFKKASEYSSDDESAAQNMEIAEYMAAHKTDYSGYLLRPPDRALMTELAETEELKDLEALRNDYNTDRRDAFKLFCLKTKNLPPHQIMDMLAPLDYFFQVVENAMDPEFETPPLHEEYNRWPGGVKQLLFLFISNAPQCDEDLLAALGDSLREFFTLLQNHKLCSPSDNQGFFLALEKEIAFFQPLLEPFLLLQHDVTLNESERMKQIAELFGISIMPLEENPDGEEQEEE